MSSSPASFEVLPFRSYGQAQSEEVRHRMGGSGSRSLGATCAKRTVHQGPYRPHRGLRRPIGGYDSSPLQTGATPDYAPALASGVPPSEQIRWVQFALNQVMNANLPTDGFASPDLRAALRDFQNRNRLPVSGFVGPDTIAALERASGSSSGGQSSAEIFEVGPRGVDEDTLNMARAQLTRIDKAIGDEKPLPFVNSEVPRGVPKVRGLYRITWGAAGPYHGRARMYNGKAGNLYLRLQAHAKEVRQLGFTLDGYEIRVLPQPHLTDKQLRALEWVINDKYIRMPGVTNERRELELPEIGAF